MEIPKQSDEIEVYLKKIDDIRIKYLDLKIEIHEQKFSKKERLGLILTTINLIENIHNENMELLDDNPEIKEFYKENNMKSEAMVQAYQNEKKDSKKK